MLCACGVELFGRRRRVVRKSRNAHTHTHTGLFRSIVVVVVKVLDGGPKERNRCCRDNGMGILWRPRCCGPASMGLAVCRGSQTLRGRKRSRMTSRAGPANCVALSHDAAVTFLWHNQRFGFRPRARALDGGGGPDSERWDVQGSS